TSLPGNAVRGREAAWYRGRAGPGGARAVYPGGHHQHGEITNGWISRGDQSHSHAMGSGKEVVVDAGSRVHGEGLRLVDAAVMPTIPSANTYAAVVMMGEFASRLIAAGHGGSICASHRHPEFPLAGSLLSAHGPGAAAPIAGP